MGMFSVFAIFYLKHSISSAPSVCAKRLENCLP